MTKSRRLTRYLSVLASMVTSSMAVSAEIETAFEVGVGHSNNIGLGSDVTLDENIGLLGVRLGLVHESNRIEAAIRSNFEYYYYESEIFDDEIVGGLDAFIDVALVEERLRWLVQDNWGQQLLDPFLPARPDNREVINFFNTGPTLLLPVGRRHQVTIGALYSNINYETSPFDSEGVSGTLQFGREMPNDSMFSLNAAVDRTEFNNDGFSADFDRLEYFARFEITEGRNLVELDLGYTELDFETATDGGELARLSWTRIVSPTASFRVGLRSDYANQADRLRRDSK